MVTQGVNRNLAKLNDTEEMFNYIFQIRNDEELLVDKERAAEQVYEKIFVGNIKGFDYDMVITRVENFSNDPKQLAKEVVAFANESIKGS